MTPTSLHKWYMNPLLTRFGKHSEYIITLWFLIPFLHAIHLVPKSRGHSLTLETFMKWSTLCIKPYDHEDRVNRLNMRSQGGRDTWRHLLCWGGHRGVASCPHHLAMTLARKKWRLTHRWDSKTAKQKDLAEWTNPRMDFCEAPLWQLLPLKNSILCTQLF